MNVGLAAAGLGSSTESAHTPATPVAAVRTTILLDCHASESSEAEYQCGQRQMIFAAKWLKRRPASARVQVKRASDGRTEDKWAEAASGVGLRGRVEDGCRLNTGETWEAVLFRWTRVQLFGRRDRASGGADMLMVRRAMRSIDGSAILRCCVFGLADW